ncbi:hypothetical protein OB920_18270 [Halobacteria archaeon HArc-gm2]|nr:hypothetical protein [Halobacteria archaeon HArc-gm2]
MRSTRRTYLTGIGGLAVTALAGCSEQAGGESAPSVATVGEPTVPPATPDG